MRTARKGPRHTQFSIVERAPSPPRVRRLAALTAVALTAGFVAMTGTSATAGPPPPSGVSNIFPAQAGGFQIDGNFDAATFDGTNQTGSIDWTSAAVATQPTGKDPIGTADTTVLSTGSKESDYAGWTMNSSAGASPKADIGNYYFFSKIFDMPNAAAHPGPHLFVYFAVERLGDTGTVDYAMELNQKVTTHVTDGGVTVPDRTVGDLRIKIFNKGGSGLTIAGTTSKWLATNEWSEEEAIPDGAISGLINDQTITDPFASDVAGRQDGTLVAEQFVELGVDLTSIFVDQEIVPTCPPTVTFGQLNMRSRASESISSEMKDIINPTRVTIPSICADLRILKVDGEGNPVEGATFLVTPNPATREGSITAVDGGVNDLTRQGTQAPADGVIDFFHAKPGSYTVLETAPPPGWLGDPNSQTQQADSSVVTEFRFVNTLGSAAWQKVDADTGEHLAGATFVVHRTSGDGTQPDITVTDNDANDANPAAGYFKVENLRTGWYTITETVAPAGYGIGPNAVWDFSISERVPNRVYDGAFQDPRAVGYLQIVKQILDSNEKPFDLTDPSLLNGTTFVVYKDANDNGKLDTGEEAHLWPNPPADSTDIATATLTDSATSPVIGPLAVGDYRVTETQKPAGTSAMGDVDVVITERSVEEPVVLTYQNMLAPLSVSITKDGPALAHVGDTVTYTFAVTNNGTTDLVDAVVTDPNADEGTLTQVSNGNGDTTLAVDETWNFTATHVVKATDPDPLANTATVTGHDRYGRTTTDTDSHDVDIIHPAITIVKTADNTTPNVGDTVTFTYVVTNTGDTTLNNVTVTDDVLGAIGTVDSLDASESTTLKKAVVVDATTPATNVATATGTDVLQKQVSATDAETISVTAVNPPAPPTPTPTVEPTQENNPPEVPNTGANVGNPVTFGLVFLLIGAAALATGRRESGRQH